MVGLYYELREINHYLKKLLVALEELEGNSIETPQVEGV